MNNTCRPEGQAKVAAQSEIPTALEQLESQSCSLQELMNRLKHKLSPVCRNSPEIDKRPPRPQQFETELANVIDSITNRIKDIWEECDAVFNSLEL